MQRVKLLFKISQGTLLFIFLSCAIAYLDAKACRLPEVIEARTDFFYGKLKLYNLSKKTHVPENYRFECRLYRTKGGRAPYHIRIVKAFRMVKHGRFWIRISMDPFTAIKELAGAKKISPSDQYVFLGVGTEKKWVHVSFPFRLECSDDLQSAEVHARARKSKTADEPSYRQKESSGDLQLQEVHVPSAESETTLKAAIGREESSPFFVRVPECQFTVEDTLKVTLPSGDVMHLFPVQPGEFCFGASEEEVNEAFSILQVRVDYETPQTIRTIERKYWVAEYELTRGQFLEYLKNDKRFYQSKDGSFFGYWKTFMEKWQHKPPNSTELRLPVSNLLLSDVEGFTTWLNAAKWKGSGKPTGYMFDPPTEIQWEYAAKGNCVQKRRLFPWGNSEEDVSQKGVFSVKNGNALEALKEPLPVGRRPEGKSWVQAHDMAGNVHELCRNYFFHYNDLETVEANGWKVDSPGKDKLRVCRGGAYNTSLWESRCSSRFQIFEDIRLSNVGVRIFFVESKD